jgi:5-methylcytosine-specific restriction protein B
MLHGTDEAGGAGGAGGADGTDGADGMGNTPVPVLAQLQKDLMELFEPLAEVGAEFGYRSAKEIARFVAIHRELSGDGWQYQDALDAQVLQKLMPKLHGSERKLSGVLRSLEKFAKDKGLPLTKNKVERMLQRLKDEGFTSFAEN